MASYDYTIPRQDIFGRISNTAAGLVGGLAAWNDARMTRKSLGQLSDRELDDIGLVRGDIDRVAGR